MNGDQKIGVYTVVNTKKITGLPFDCTDDLFHFDLVFPNCNPHILCMDDGCREQQSRNEQKNRQTDLLNNLFIHTFVS